MKKRLENLIRVKSLVTLSMTVALIVLLFWCGIRQVEPQKELLTLFCTSYGAVITYFFTRKDNENATAPETGAKTGEDGDA